MYLEFIFFFINNRRLSLQTSWSVLNMDEYDKIRSVGRRQFPVLKHHSIYYGTVFRDGDVSDHFWNCNSLDIKVQVGKKPNINNKFMLTEKSTTVPYVYE